MHSTEGSNIRKGYKQGIDQQIFCLCGCNKRFQKFETTFSLNLLQHFQFVMHLFLLWNFHANLRIPISSDCIQTDYSRKNFSIELKTVLYA